MPDAQGKIRGIVVPRVPWKDEDEEKRKQPRTFRRFVTRGSELVEVGTVVRETR